MNAKVCPVGHTAFSCSFAGRVQVGGAGKLCMAQLHLVFGMW